MKCILHIGTEKTGTTSIQQFIFENRALLKKKGFHLFDSLRQPDNRFLAVAAMHPSTRDGLTRNVLRLNTDNEVLAFQNKTIADFKTEVNRLPKGATALISSEHIQSRLRTEDEVQRLHSILRECGFQSFQIIVYLRNPADTASSLYSTMIKGGRMDATVPAPEDHNVENICNHQKTIEKFSAVFGRENLTVRLFRADKLVDGSAVTDIAHVLGLDLSSGQYAIPAKQNESLSALGLRLLQKVNAQIPVYENGKMRQERAELIRHVVEQYANPPFSLTNEQREAYDHYFASSNRWVKEHFFPDEAELFPKLKTSPKPKSVTDQEFNACFQTLMDWWNTRKESIEPAGGKKDGLPQKIKRLAKRLGPTKGKG